MMDNGDWIRSRSLLDLIRGSRKDWATHPEGFLRPALEGGLIDAKAKLAKITTRTEYHGKREREERDWLVPAQVWKGNQDNSTFNLISDRYRSRAPGMGCADVELIGLSFCRSQLFEYADISASEGSESKAGVLDTKISAGPFLASDPRDKGGAPLDSEKWANLVGVFAGYLSARELKPETKPGSLYKQLLDYADRIGVTIPAKSTSNDAMKRALKWSKAQHDVSGQPLNDKDGVPLALD